MIIFRKNKEKGYRVIGYKGKGNPDYNPLTLQPYNPTTLSSGFTLVEMMVSIAIFMVVAVVAVAALLKIVDANRKSQTLQDAVNNINFAMDSITRSEEHTSELQSLRHL